MRYKTLLFTALSIAVLVFPGFSHAAGELSVRLGQPKTPTNQNNLKLTFVALEIGGTDSISVSCYKKSPSDGDYVKFQDLSLIPGGNTDFCNVGSGILSSSGTYYFKVIANGLKESNVVSVTYNSSGPSTPGSYSKEKINSCEYRIKFKTADDGRTVKVELFRSDSYSISVNSNNVLASQNIGPNQEGSFVVGAPDCNKQYYFAIRAVDNADNTSGTTGDDFTKTITETNTTITSSGGSNSPQGAIPVTSGSQVQEVGTAAGEPAASTNSETSVTVSPEASSPAVLGTTTSKYSWLKWFSVPLLLAAAFFFRKAWKRA